MPMMEAYLMKLDSRRHMVSPRLPNTPASSLSSCWMIIVTVITTQAIMMHIVTAKTFRP